MLTWAALAVRQRRIMPGRPLICATTLPAVPAGDRLDRLGRAARSCRVHCRISLGRGGLQKAAPGEGCARAGSARGPSPGPVELAVSRRGRSLAGPRITSRLGSRATAFKAPEGAVLESLAHRAAFRRAVCQPQAVGMRGFVWEDVAWCVLVGDTWRNEAAVLFLFAVENEAGLQLDASRQSVRHDKGYKGETHRKLRAPSWRPRRTATGVCSRICS